MGELSTHLRQVSEEVYAFRAGLRLDARLVRTGLAFGLCILACAVILSALPLYFYLRYHIFDYEDDAYYYFVIVRNIHDFGFSSFDQQTLTNGYQPLWLCLLLLEYWLTGSFDGTLIIELLLILGGLGFLLAALNSRRIIDNAILAFAFAVSVANFTMNGMEGSLLVFCLSALYWAIERLDLKQDKTALGVGVIAALAIGARIDVGVFVLPLVALSMPTMRGKAISIGVVAGLGLFYGASNLAIFGSVIPVSAAVKSLGGLHFNRHLFDDFRAQMFDSTFAESIDCIIDSSCGNSDYYRVVLLIPLAAALLVLAKRKRLARHLLAAFLIGIAAYAAKLFLASSWSIWPWYFFPVFIGMYASIRAASFVLKPWLRGRRGLAVKAGVLAAILAMIVIPARSYVASPPNYDWQGFSVINQRAIQRFGAVLKNQRVAMGDRSGSFAYRYPGPVTQLEGLVEDKSYLRLIEKRGDLKALLCKRGVKYIAAYALDLGNYTSYTIPALRSWLTSFTGPAVIVQKSDEIGRVFDRDVFDSADLGDEGDSYLYIWRLSGCPAEHPI